MTIMAKFAPLKEAYDMIKAMGADPFSLKFDEILSPTEGMLNGKRTILLGTNNYLGLTFTVRATSREQLDALYQELSGHPMVKIVL